MTDTANEIVMNMDETDDRLRQPEGVEEVRQGKLIEVVLDEKDEIKAREKVEKMCEKLLANTVIENYEFDLVA